MKIGIITFHDYNNYGAILQSYALQKVLMSRGCDSEIIDYKCEYIRKPYRLINLRKKGLFTYLFGLVGFICYLPRKKRCDIFRKQMKYSMPFCDSNIDKIADTYDAYITGSDQVWNYKLTNFDKNYFLKFVSDDTKKFSYAASFGLTILDEQYKSEYAKLLSSFNAITVREEQGANIVNELTSRMPEIVLDPTLMLTCEEWNEVTKKYKNDSDYILVYQLGLSKKVIEFTKKLSNECNCKIIFVPFPLGKFIKSKISISIGPDGWLGLFKNAKYVVTDSFHGIIFSVLFNKNFYAEVSGQHKNSRAENFLSRFKLSDRIIDNVKDLHQIIDYNEVNKEITIEREKSIQCLKNMLNI